MNHQGIGRNVIIGLIVVSICASASSALTVTPSPRPLRGILYVGGSGPGNYTTIQEAVDNSTNGDTIYVYANTYPENVDTKLKKVALVGEDAATTIIEGQTSAPTIKIGASEVSVTGFTLLGTVNEAVVLVGALCENVVIADNIVTDGGYGISLAATSSRVTVSGNTVTSQDFVGIQLKATSFNDIVFNTVEASGGQGIVLSSSHHNTVANNSVTGNAKEGILCEGVGGTDNTFSGNAVVNNEVGIRCSAGGSNAISGNIIQDNTREGVLLQTSNENTIERNNIIDNGRQATYRLATRTTWDANYWSNWIGFKFTQPLFQKFPKFIKGIFAFNLDKHPATAPYNITVLA